jgi:hypothetical protein
MSHFARVQNGVVIEVNVAERDILDTGLWGDPAEWIQTSYNTHGGVHYDPATGQPDGGIALRANYAGRGYTYDAENDVFYAPQPYPSWTIAAPAWTWTPPVAYPTDGKIYTWTESTLTWDLAPIQPA